MPITSRVTMYGPAIYEVWVQGHLEEGWIPQIAVDSIALHSDPEGGPVTVLTATFRDQAELRGLLERIYSLNLPLVAVRAINPQQ